MIRNPIVRIATGLVCLGMCLFVVADALFGLVPSEEAALRSSRARAADIATLQVVDKLNAQDLRGLAPALRLVRERYPDLLSVGVLQQGGALVAASGPYPPPAQGAWDHVRIPIHAAEGVWGSVDFVFPAAAPSTLRDWLLQRRLWISAGLLSVMVVCAVLYLRRALSYLDPMTVVPERIRAAFDSLAEGVALLDRSGRTMLANQALREMAGVEEGRLHGRLLQEATVLTLPASSRQAPWMAAMDSGRAVRDTRVTFGEAGQRVGRVDCSPLLDSRGKVRGSLVTLNDLTAVERSNDQLREAMAALEQSRATVEAQNRELARLALYDGLTGLLNRRSFMESAEAGLSRCRRARTSAAALMVDVDHFKSFNDRHGHAVGDLVLQQVARCLQRALRTEDLCARYGGEEFCVLMEGISMEDALQRAERIRHLIETQAGRAVREVQGLRITVSVGLCVEDGAKLALPAMLKRADEALYRAKHGGRNRVEAAASALDVVI